jgi:predicted transcriptional regulator
LVITGFTLISLLSLDKATFDDVLREHLTCAMSLNTYSDKRKQKKEMTPVKKNEDIMASDYASKSNRERIKCYQKMKKEFKSYQNN